MRVVGRSFRRALGASIVMAALLPAAASAATYTITNSGDPVPGGGCSADPGGTGTCSLREAVIAANLSVGTPDTITLATSVTLSQAGAGEDGSMTGDLDVTDDLTINGPSPAFTIGANFIDRVLDVPGTPTSANLTLSGIKVRNGLASGPSAKGGGIRFVGATPFKTLSLSGADVSSNHADATTGIASGGGIWAGDPVGVAHVLIQNGSTILGNNAGGLAANREGTGGGVAIEGADGNQLSVSGGSSISNNAAGGGGANSPGRGGGIFADVPTTSVAAVGISLSNVNGNSAGFAPNSSIPSTGGLPANNGGGIAIRGGGSLGIVGGTVNSNSASGGTGNSAAGYGGGIARQGSGATTLNGVTLSGNTAARNGGTGTGIGGAIYTEGNLSVSGGQVASNSALFGAGLYMETTGSPTLSISNGANLSGNVSNSGNGGAIQNNSSGQMTVSDATINNNFAGAGAGILRQGASPNDLIQNTTISGNTAGGSQAGGGIFTSFGGTMTIDRSTLSGNHATSGQGGGLYARSQINFTNSTIANNDAQTQGGGVYLDTTGKLGLTLSTVTGGSAFGSGGNLYLTDVAGDATLTGSVIAGGTAPSAPSTANCFQTVPGVAASLGYNVEQTTSQCGIGPGPGDLAGVPSAGLGTLANNGGPTFTQLPALSSPVVDLVPSAVCLPLIAPDTDQRGLTRPRDANGDGTAACDAGSVELQPPGLTLFGTNPISGSNNNNPTILGSTDIAATVKVYTTAGCTGAPVATGTGSQLNGAGIPVTVADNTSTVFYLTAEKAEGITACSAGVVYAEVTPAVVQPPPGTPPKKKCKKGKKLKKVHGKKKCVKKKHKKK